MTDYREHYYQSPDGLTLYAKIYNPNQKDQTILCMHGLTRNSADFDAVAEHLSEHYRVISVDQRGRGNSEWDPDINHYTPLNYVQDMWALLDGLHIDQVALIGTSMGGLMSIMMGAEAPNRIMGIVLNDIGPQIESKGLERIKNYIGQDNSYNSWQHLADITKEIHGQVFPNYRNEDWLKMAKRTGCVGEDGMIRMNYDPALAKPVHVGQKAAIPLDLWSSFDALKGKKILTIRGELSDILSIDVLDKMARNHKGLKTHTVPNEGHAPMMDDKATLAVIDLWAEQVFGGN